VGKDLAFSLREAEARDAEAVARIVRDELGYAADPGVVAEVIGRSNAGGQLLLVAESGGGVVGFAHAGSRDSLYKGRIAELYSLAVAAASQGSGAGSALVAEAERRFAAAGCGQIILGSRMEREEAHRFYEDRGYHREKIHARFAKRL
jgi:ribosomal protein S18 acetylase RimI-like enzyme